MQTTDLLGTRSRRHWQVRGVRLGMLVCVLVQTQLHPVALLLALLALARVLS